MIAALPYRDKSYGRQQEVADLYDAFDRGDNISMHGPWRLGKTFLLDRLVEQAPERRWVAVKVELAGCTSAAMVFRELCSRLGERRSGGEQAKSYLLQRLTQCLGASAQDGGPWYQAFIHLDHAQFLERLIRALHEDTARRWVLLIDELPIFLKALHDQGTAGVDAARQFMNQLIRMQQACPRVRWLITGSIGIEPLARLGQYLGTLAKFRPFTLHPLPEGPARDLVQDLAREGKLMGRQCITDDEANCLVAAVGWRSAFYLEAVAQKVRGAPSEDREGAQQAIEDAVSRLLEPSEMATFGPWEEHIRKHYRDAECAVAFAVLNALAVRPQGLDLNNLLAQVAKPALTRDALLGVLQRLHIEGFVEVDDWAADQPVSAFRNPLLKRWWQRYRPQP
ncbi:ATP-binding protein [Hydrogenophaga sp.]|uniref:ATP-binding protein n=1 Tax=Hydrogenophaga sp. TaxID=1904254 RepID=UPI0035B27368